MLKFQVYLVESQNVCDHIVLNAFHPLLVEVQTNAGYLHAKLAQQQTRGWDCELLFSPATNRILGLILVYTPRAEATFWLCELSCEK